MSEHDLPIQPPENISETPETVPPAPSPVPIPADTVAIPVPDQRPQVRFPLIWLVPLLALLLGGWLVFATWSRMGPLVVITFKSAEGIVAGKTKIKHKDVEVGEVKAVRLSKGFSQVEVEARLVPEMADYLSIASQFWVVRPRLTMSGVTGLGALVSGAHIEIEPAFSKDGSVQSRFKGLEEPPLVRTDSSGVRIVLFTQSVGSLMVGSPVYFRGIVVGEVLGVALDGKDMHRVVVHAYIRSPHHGMLRKSSRFWKLSGIDIAVGSEGVRVKTESFQKMLMGGIDFDTPDNLEEQSQVTDGATFTLHEDKEQIDEAENIHHSLHYLLHFDGSVRGLNIGAPVEFMGIKVGSVNDIRLIFDQEQTAFRVAVLVQMEPERIARMQLPTENGAAKVMTVLVQRGLRARLQTGSFLTGLLYVELSMQPDTPIHLLGGNNDYPELPTLPGKLEEITGSLTNLLNQLQTIPIDQIGQELHGVLRGMNRTVNAPEILESLLAMKQALKSLEVIALALEKRAEPLGDEALRATQVAGQALQATHKVMEGLGELVGQDAPLNYRMLELSQELTSMARSIRGFIELMERNPESMVYGRQKGQSP